MQGTSHSTTRRLPPPTSGYDSPERRLPGHFSPPPPELPKHLSRGPSREHLPEQMKNKIEVRVSQSVESRALIGPDQLRYSALIGGHLTVLVPRSVP